ncbi:hypothetical protein HDV05_006883, partial [Chytridiales sp. JEL 0842]
MAEKKIQLTQRNTAVPSAHKGPGVRVGVGAKLHHASKPKSILHYKRLYFSTFVALLLPFIASDWIPQTSFLGSAKERLRQSFSGLSYLPSGLQFALLVSVLAAGYFVASSGGAYVRFAYNCFVKPFLKRKADGLGSKEHQERLEAFYEGQADIYDETRRRLLRGRTTMLKLCSAQLAQFYPVRFANDFQPGIAGETVTDPSILPSPPLSPSFLATSNKRYAWIDIGGGTGANVEMMNAVFPIRNFDKVYVVDITPSLCKVAEERFKRLGWTNVTVLCMDATKFQIPKEDGEDLEIALVTLSYSLSMIESYYGLIDSITNILSPTGIIGIADFYVSSK